VSDTAFWLVAEQWQSVEPRDLRPQIDDGADDRDDRCIEPLACDGVRQRGDRRDDAALPRVGAPLHRGRRRIGRHAAGDERRGDPGQRLHAHVQHDRAAGAGE
jgi:hypothetical protein